MSTLQKLNSIYFIKQITEFVKFCISKWVLIFSIVIITGIIGATYNWVQKPKYIAELTFSLEDNSSGSLGGYANLAMQLGISLGNSSSGVFKGDNLFELMKSRFILEKTLLSKASVNKKNDLYVNHFLNITKQGPDFVKRKLLPTNYFSENRVNYTLQQDSILNKIQEDFAKQYISIYRIDKKLSIISLSVINQDQYFAIEFCKQLVNNLTAYYITTVTQKERADVNMLENQTDSVRRLMSGAISDVAISNDLNVNPLRQIIKVPSQQRQLDITALSLAYGELMKNLALAKINLNRETPLIQIIDSPRPPLINKKKGRMYGFILGTFLSSLLLFPILILLFKINKFEA